MTDLNPQASRWPTNPWFAGSMPRLAPSGQEIPLLRRYSIPADARILDSGCGTGQGSSRLAELFSPSDRAGVDVIDAHVDLARSRYAAFGSRLSFEHRRIFELRAPNQSFDLTLPPRAPIHSLTRPRNR